MLRGESKWQQARDRGIPNRFEGKQTSTIGLRSGLLPRTIRLVRPIPVGCLLVQLGSLVLGAPGEMGVQPC